MAAILICWPFADNNWKKRALEKQTLLNFLTAPLAKTNIGGHIDKKASLAVAC